MEFDIVPELLEKIKEDYEKNVAAVNTEELLSKLLKSKNLDDAYAYARKIGQALSDAFVQNISADLLPNGRMYFNIANRLIPPTLTRAYKDSANISEIIMANINAQNKIGMMVQQGIMNSDRITGIVDRLSEAEKFEDVKFLTGRAVMQNVTQSAVDDTIEANAQFQYKSGIRARVERKLGGKCCAWCQRLVGKYTYPDVPEDVYRRHENCRCTVIYYPGKGYTTQNVHTKEYKEIDLKEDLQQHKAGKKVFITDKAINSVKNVSIPGLSDEENQYLKSTHMDLLKFARANNFSNEVGCIVEGKERINFVKGTVDSCNLESDADGFHWLLTKSNLTVCHNHPGLSDFSFEDIDFFVRYESIKRMTIVTNTGHVKYLAKSPTYDFDTTKNFLISLRNENNSKKYIVDNFLKKAYTVGVERGR